MAPTKVVDTDPHQVLVPILATQLVAQYQRLLRTLAQSLEKKRGQPPKRVLAAAKVLYQCHPEVVYLTSSNGADQANGSPDAGELDLDEAAAESVVEAVESLEQWLMDGHWAASVPGSDLSPPPLLSLIEQTTTEVSDGDRAPRLVTDLISEYRDVVAWGHLFIDQRPPDSAARDGLVLLTAARFRVMYQDESIERPARATALLSQPTDRLVADWADLTAPGVTTYSKGHFGNDQAQFNDACRALVIDLLARAINKPGSKPKTIYLASTIFDRADGWLKAEFDQKISECLAAGWRVAHVLGTDETPGGSGSVGVRTQVDFASHVLADIETIGIYVPILAPAEVSTDMALVEGVGAVIFPSIGYSSLTERRSTTVPPSPAMAIRCITGRGGTGDGPAATPVVAELRAEAKELYPDAEEGDHYLDKRKLNYGFRVPTENLRWFDRQLTASELLEGDRYALKAWLPTSTVPDDVSSRQFTEWERQLELLRDGVPDTSGLTRGWSDDAREAARDYMESKGWDWIQRSLRRLMNKRAVRHFGFETNVVEYRYRDCVLASRLVDYLTEPDPWFSSNPIYGPGGLTLEQRQRHMLFLASHLEKTRVNNETLVGHRGRAGYSLGLVDDQVGQPYDLTQTWWLATRSHDQRADQVHYLHQRHRNGRAWVATLTNRSVADFNAVQTFIAVFDGIWYSIDMPNRLPETVADVILDLLPANMRSEFGRLSPDGVAR